MQHIGLALALSPDAPDAEDVAAVYRHAVRVGALPASVSAAAQEVGLPADVVAGALDELRTSRLLRLSADADLLLPVDPDVAAAVLAQPVEREIAERRERITQIQERTEAFRREYSLAPVQRGAVQDVVGSAELRGCLAIARAACRKEALVLLSGREEPGEVDAVLSLCAALRTRGVPVRIVCQHRNRTDLVVRPRLRRLLADGAEVRTVSCVPRAAVVMDRCVALLVGGEAGEAGEGASAVRVQHDAVLDFLMGVFDHLWDVAAPLDPHDAGCADVADDLLQTIAGLMAKGFTDEVLARKLGMSLRTCRRHIASLMRDLDAVSRFQAGVQAAHRELLPA